MNKVYGFAILVTGLLSACVSPPERMDVETEFAVPGEWVAGGDAQEVSDQWWRDFENEELDALLGEALDFNPDLQVFVGRFEQAAANARIAGADLYPNLDLGFGAQRSRQNFIGLPIPGGGSDVLTTRNTSYNLSLSSAWELDLWGRVRAGKRAALADYQASAQDLRGASQSMAAQVAKAWINVIAAKRQLDLSTRSAESFRDTADKLQFRYERGLTSSLDLRLAINSAENAEALLQSRLLQYQEAVKVLEILLGRYPSGDLEIAGEFPGVAEEVPVGMPSTLLERRPDMIAAERRLAATDQRLWQAKAALLPRISLSASAGTSSSQLDDLGDLDFSVWSIAANLAQPIFQGGRLLANVDLSKARIYEAANQYLSLALQAFREVETSMESARYLEAQERHLVEASRQADAALDLANLRYENGLAEFINVLESQRRSLSDAGVVIDVQRQRLINRIELYLALGGGFPDLSEQENADPEEDLTLSANQPSEN